MYSITNQHLNQLNDLIHKLSDEQFSKPITALKGSSIGSHVRHVIEFFDCLCDALETGELNYDLRKRDLDMEKSTVKCIETISRISKNLNQFDSDFPLKLNADYSILNKSEQVTLDTTFYRELLYNVEHTVHHLAIIRIGVASVSPLIELEEHLGVAASTLRNKMTCAQ
tara:strand:- start:97992 stop:98498 length:507 start_codon:yes stop_codon:yes gene_type:complete